MAWASMDSCGRLCHFDSAGIWDVKPLAAEFMI
jgi:hypothetical protein